MKLPAQKRTERRISVVSSAGTAKESVSIAKQRSRARGAAMYLIVFLEDKVVGDLGLNKSCGWFWTGQKGGRVRQVWVEAPLVRLQRSKW